MAIVLNGVTLSGSMLWTDRFSHSPVEQETHTTLGGNVLYYSKGVSNGRPITLEATEDTGWITKAMLDSIVGMAATPGAVYTLSFHGESHSVVFRHHDAPAVDFQPLQPKASIASGDYFVGVLKLITI